MCNVYFEFFVIVLICTYSDVSWQICEEFFRITNKDLLGTFRTAVDKYTPKLLRLYRARKGPFGKEMEEVLEKLDDEVQCWKHLF